MFKTTAMSIFPTVTHIHSGRKKLVHKKLTQLPLKTILAELWVSITYSKFNELQYFYFLVWWNSQTELFTEQRTWAGEEPEGKPKIRTFVFSFKIQLSHHRHDCHPVKSMHSLPSVDPDFWGNSDPLTCASETRLNLASRFKKKVNMCTRAAGH